MAVSGDACNRGNFFGEKPSSRVLAQPGGNSSFSLGWGQPEPQQQRAPRGAAPAPAPAQENFAPAQHTNVEPRAEPVKAAGGRAESSNAWASNASQNSGNMISDRPTSRVLAPPGGKSSITF